MKAAVQIIGGISEIADRYDGFIVDLWGVLHDGIAPFPGAIDALQYLKGEGKRVCLLSNAPRRAGLVDEKMRGLGFSGLYDHLLTSGEAAYQALRDRTDPWHAALGPRFIHLGPQRDISCYQGLPLERVETPEEADFILNTGTYDGQPDLTSYSDFLMLCATRCLPMLCANPDRVVHVGDELQICAGSLADVYQGLGGDVFFHGKPHKAVYDRCLMLLDCPPARVLGIGDSMVTDIAGAATSGIDSLLLAGGIHREEFAVEWGQAPALAVFESFVSNREILPTWLSGSLKR